MKYCYECGYKLEGNEKSCPECGEIFDTRKEAEQIVNSIFDQVIGGLDELKEEATKYIGDFDLEDVLDDLDINTKVALNRDTDYIVRARKKMEKTREFNRVITLCDKALIVNPKNWEAYFLKGVALFNLGRYGEAIEMLLNSLALNEDNLDARVYIARSYFYKGNEEYALSVYDSILNIDDKYFDALEGKALIYFSQKDYENADKYFKKASIVSVLSDDSKDKWDVCLEKMEEE